MPRFFSSNVAIILNIVCLATEGNKFSFVVMNREITYYVKQVLEFR